MFPLTGRLHVHVTDRLVYRLWVLEGFPDAHSLCYAEIGVSAQGMWPDFQRWAAAAPHGRNVGDGGRGGKCKWVLVHLSWMCSFVKLVKSVLAICFQERGSWRKVLVGESSGEEGNICCLQNKSKRFLPVRLIHAACFGFSKLPAEAVTAENRV